MIYPGLATGPGGQIGALATGGAAEAAAADFWMPTTGSFTPVAAYRAIGAASQAASYVNLVNPGTYDLTPGVAPTFDASYGWGFNGSTMYLITGIVPTTGGSILVRFSDGGEANNWLIALDHAGVGTIGFRPSNGFNQHSFYNAGDLTLSGHITEGVLGIAAKAAYVDGSHIGTIAAGTATWMNPLYIGARNLIGVGADDGSY